MQYLGGEQVPQFETVRKVPQLSLPLTCPQSLRKREQNAALVSGTQGGTQAAPVQTLEPLHWADVLQLVAHALPLHV